jgi:hypothetical protein
MRETWELENRGKTGGEKKFQIFIDGLKILFRFVSSWWLPDNNKPTTTEKTR